MDVPTPPPAARPRHALWRFMGYVWPHTPLITVATLCGILKFILPMTMAVSMRFLTDRLAGHPSVSEKTDVSFRATEAYLAWLAGHLPAPWSTATPWGLFQLLMLTLVVVYAFWGVSVFFRTYLSQLAGHRVILNLRVDLYQHITRMGHSFFQERQSGGIVSRLMSDIALAQNFVGSAMTSIWMDLASSVFYIALLFSMDVPLTFASLLVFPFYIASMKTFGRQSKETTKAVQAALEDFSGDVQERIAGIHVVKSFAAEARETESFTAGARGLFDLTMKNVRITATANALTQWLTQMATLGLMWYGGYRLLTGQVSVGTVIAFIMLLRELYFPINRISEMNTILHNSLAAIDRVFEVFDIQPDVKELPHAQPVKQILGRVTFEHVTFGYEPLRPILRDIHLDVAPGELIALVGPSGAGKTTLVQLVSRFYDPQEGRVLVDGRDVRQLKLRGLRKRIGIVAQETLLFTGSARDNLLYGRPDASEEEMLRAAHAAHAHEFITQLPEGYNTLLGERGAKLSGGQKQRLALARAFLCDPRILVLDEATSALDSESEHLIQSALGELLHGRTSFIIAHRLSTILNADRIVVMDQGRIVDVGPHGELLQRDGLYARLYHTQFRTPVEV